MSWLTDAHIHLSDNEFAQDLPFIFTAMNKLKIKACCVSVDFHSSMKTLELSSTSKLIYPFLGQHPEKGHYNPEQLLQFIEKNSNKISGIGEIGLDRTYASDEADFNNQINVFHKMLSIAEKLDKPISIHSRRTLEEIFSILPSYHLDKILLHWFAGSKKQLQKATDLGYFVSYGPAMVYSQDKQILLSATDPSKILLETDGPVRFSKCFGLKTAQPLFLPSVLFCASNILEKSYGEMLKTIEENMTKYLGV